MYLSEPSEDCTGYAISELYCNADGSDWGYCTVKGSYFKTKCEAEEEVKRLMDAAEPNAYRKVNWIIDKKST